MASLDDLIKPFKTTASFLADKESYQMVPFQKWAVRKMLNQPSSPKMPNIELTFVPALREIIPLIPGAGDVLIDMNALLEDLAQGHFDKVIPEFAKLVPNTLHFVGHQLGLGLSLAALLDIVGNLEKIPEAISQAYQSYFFDENGFTTLEGGRIAPPSFELGVDTASPSLAQIASEVRKFASHKTGDQYIRDLIRITVESSGDAFSV